MTPTTADPRYLPGETRPRNPEFPNVHEPRLAGDDRDDAVTIETRPDGVDIFPGLSEMPGRLRVAPARSGFPLSPSRLPGHFPALDQVRRTLSGYAVPPAVLSSLLALGDEVDRSGIRGRVARADRARAGISGRLTQHRAEHRRLVDEAMARPVLAPESRIILDALGGNRRALQQLADLVDTDPLAAAVLALWQAMDASLSAPELVPLSSPACAVSDGPSALCAPRGRQHRRRPRPVVCRCLIVSRPSCAPPVLVPVSAPANKPETRARPGP